MASTSTGTVSRVRADSAVTSVDAHALVDQVRDLVDDGDDDEESRPSVAAWGTCASGCTMARILTEECCRKGERRGASAPALFASRSGKVTSGA
jgi:hypothetical protein